MKRHFKTIGLRANSIGTWFAMQGLDSLEFERCLFVSPVLNMEKLIQNMMLWAGVSEERLKGDSLTPTDFRETLSRKYYEYVKARPIKDGGVRLIFFMSVTII